jgi:hypothetical protein
VSFVLVVDMAGDMRGCGPLDVGNGQMGFHVDNGMDFFGLFSNWLTCVPVRNIVFNVGIDQTVYNSLLIIRSVYN